MELIVVVAILGILAGILVPMLGGTTDKAQSEAANVSLTEIRDAIMGRPGSAGFYTDTGTIPHRMPELFFNPAPGEDPTKPSEVKWAPGLAFPSRNYPFPAFDRNTRRGWHGPYLGNSTGQYAINNTAGFTAKYGQVGDAAMMDPWGRPFVIQWPTVGAAADQQDYVRLVSAGPDGILQTLPDALYNGKPYPLPASRGDDIVIFLRRADVAP